MGDSFQLTPHRGTAGSALPTSRLAHHQERGVLSILRALLPRRPLTPFEAERIAELQANRLLELAGINAPAVPSQIVSELPRISVCTDIDLPVSGTADWHNGRWILTINGAEDPRRQRFSLAHEFKHVLDHRYRDVLYANLTPPQVERIADYFAACLLMPKKLMLRHYGLQQQKVSVLSDLFEVSPRAMQVRLWQLGLVGNSARCEPHKRWQPKPSWPAQYHRAQAMYRGVTV